MKKIFTTLIAGSLIVTTGIEVKANTANSALKSTTSCSEAATVDNYQMSSHGAVSYTHLTLPTMFVV